MKHIEISVKVLRPLIHLLNRFKDLGDFIIRCWVANVFFTSGMSKLADWDTTLVLFKYVYSTPFMSPAIAAYIGTGVELIFPILLVLGLGGRLFLFCFFVYNIICVLSFHFLLTPMGTAGLDDHIMWGLLLMMLMFHGMGRFSLDHLIHKKYGHFIHTSYHKEGS
jgi:putative oxidoreductase